MIFASPDRYCRTQTLSQKSHCLYRFSLSWSIFHPCRVALRGPASWTLSLGRWADVLGSFFGKSVPCSLANALCHSPGFAGSCRFCPDGHFCRFSDRGANTGLNPEGCYGYQSARLSTRRSKTHGWGFAERCRLCYDLSLLTTHGQICYYCC